MAIKRVFKCTIPSCKYIFLSGKEANFIQYEYYTDIKQEIEELEKEIALGHPNIYIDKNKKEIDTEKTDPIELIKQKAIQEYLAAQQVAIDPNNDRGNTSLERLKVANSKDISEAVAGSNSGAVLVQGMVAAAATGGKK